MDFDPIDNLFLTIGRLMPNTVIPDGIVGQLLFQSAVHIDAALETVRVLGINTLLVHVAQRLQASAPRIFEIGCIFNCFFERQSYSSPSALATALATAALARPLNSVSPPHPAFPASSVSGSKSEMSLVRPLTGSK